MTGIFYGTPGALLEGRLRALAEADFALVYDSYHPDAPFLQHFPARQDYLAFAEQNLADVSLVEWKLFAQRRSGCATEVLCWLRMDIGGACRELYELALLIASDDGWSYHSAQKLTPEDYAGPAEKIDFHHFDNAEPKIRF
jgi:SEC-C motif-containing protein